MNYFDLLPNEIIDYIYFISKQSYSADTISKFYKNRLQQKKIIEYVICDILWDQLRFNSLTNDFTFLSDFNIQNLSFLLNNSFSKKYNITFWQYLLSSISFKLMNIYNSILILNFNFNSNFYYKNLKIAINIWFKLCQKHNIKLCLYQFNKNNIQIQTKRILARHIFKINNFNNFFSAPQIIRRSTILNTSILLEQQSSYNYLDQFYYELLLN